MFRKILEGNYSNLCLNLLYLWPHLSEQCVEAGSSSSKSQVKYKQRQFTLCGNGEEDYAFSSLGLEHGEAPCPTAQNVHSDYIRTGHLVCSEMAIFFPSFKIFSLMFLCISGALLPPPQNITIMSTNMKHFLLWNPVIVPGEDVKYSVEFQGEYERDYANDSWISIGECTNIRITQCDITEDISATVPYSLRVRAAVGTQASHWATLNGFFNRITTSLIPPTLTVTADGYHLLVELGHLGPSFEFWIFYWRKSQEHQVHHKVVRESGTAVHLETMEAKAEYCVKAQTYVEAINRSSNFSDVQCVKARDGKPLWMTFAPLFLVIFVVSVLGLSWVTWKICQICRYSCCPNEAMPDTLKLTESTAGMLTYGPEEVEKCDESVQVLPPEEFSFLFDS